MSDARNPKEGAKVLALLRPMLPMVLVLAVPIVPFLLFGERIDASLANWKEAEHSPAIVASVVIGLLATDIFLPIPSSLICTLAGWELGFWAGAGAAWTGMSLGAVIGFALSRWSGPPLAWLTRADDLEQTRRLAERFGPALLVLARGVPVLAEASILLVGLHGLSWNRFLPPVLLSNLGLAVGYAWFGQVAAEREWLVLVLVISVAAPVFLAMVFRWISARD